MGFSIRDKADILLGVLGYTNNKTYSSDYETAFNLLSVNDFDINKIQKLQLALETDIKTESSYISLAGTVANIKIKNSDIDKIIYYVNLYDVNINIG